MAASISVKNGDSPECESSELNGIHTNSLNSNNKFVAARAGSGRNAISVDTLGNKVCCTESRESLAIGDISKQYWLAYRTV
jgi:hypothetical protein